MSGTTPFSLGICVVSGDPEGLRVRLVNQKVVVEDEPLAV